MRAKLFHGPRTAHRVEGNGWWSGPGLNRQPPACKADALPIELPPHRAGQTQAIMVGLGRVELPTSPLSGARSDQLSYRPSRRLFCADGKTAPVGSTGCANWRSFPRPPMTWRQFTRFADCQRPKSPQREAQASQNRIVMRREPDGQQSIRLPAGAGRLTWSEPLP
jgi:hypothetical protein